MKYLYLYSCLIFSYFVHGQSIIGPWEIYDDATKEKKALIEIYTTDQRYFAKIIESYVGDKNAICDACEGTKKDKPIAGLVIIA